MDSEANETMEVAALGRPFGLGMLYDCRKDSLIPGITLWDRSDLIKQIGDRPQNYNDFEIVASESIEDKSSALNIEASLKASFMSGLIQVGGSAKYLSNSKTSRNQARVTLKYKATTKVQELSMDHLGINNVKHPYIFEKGLATHVVTAILYGAQAFFVFDREVSEKEDHQDIEGNLKLMIKRLPSLAVDGQGSLKMESNDRANVNKFSCKFFGDFSLQKTPTTFEDAIQVYQSLPSLLGPNGENAVPMKVWLLPLSSLDSSAAKLVRQISIRLVQESQSVLEDFSELEMRCNDSLNATTAQLFPQVVKKIKTFRELCSEFKQDFQQSLAKRLPLIRGGGEEESVLAEILMKRHSSPFNTKDLNVWMDCKEREIYTLMVITKMLKNTTIVPSQNHLFKEILRAEHALCFVFSSLGGAESYLSNLSNYLRQASKPGDHPDIEKEQWYASKAVADATRHKAKLFSDFAEANKDSEDIMFLTVGLTDETQKGSCIYYYNGGFSVNENFEPPSKPEALAVRDINHNSVTLKISPPKFGAENLTSYRVEFCIMGEAEWQHSLAPPAEEVTVGDLSPNTQYQLRCRAVTSIGVGPADEISLPVRTLPCSPPGQPQVDPNSSGVLLTWEKPTEFGEDVEILSYIVEYAKTGSDGNVQWNHVTSAGEKVSFPGSEFQTEYVIRVTCDCGVAGRSKKSISNNVCITKHQQLNITVTDGDEGASPSVLSPPLKEEDADVEGCRVCSFGNESTKGNRTIILFGQSGSGKSTLINGMINYVAGVEWKDDFRFRLTHKDQAELPTSEVTVYKIHPREGFRIDHSLTIVDTPGFGDVGGTRRDEETIEYLRNLFCSEVGVGEIDAVCVVVQAAVAELTTRQKYLFDSVLSIFDKNVAENVRVLVTFADGQRPPVVEAINASGVPCPKTHDGLPVYFKFNNSTLFANNKPSASNGTTEPDCQGFDQMFWNMWSMKSMEKFFAALGVMTTKSLEVTTEVLKERKQIVDVFENLLGFLKRKGYKKKSEHDTKSGTPPQGAAAKLTPRYDVDDEEVELMDSIAESFSRLGEMALKPELLPVPEYISMLVDGERSEATPGWKRRVRFLTTSRESHEADDDDDDEEEEEDVDVFSLMKMMILPYLHHKQMSTNTEIGGDDVKSLLTEMMKTYNICARREIIHDDDDDDKDDDDDDENEEEDDEDLHRTIRVARRYKHILGSHDFEED